MSAICWASLKFFGHHEVHAHLVAGAAVADRPQDPGLGPARSGVVGEDVVDLVAPPGSHAAHLLAGAIALLELGLGLEAVVDLVVGVALVLSQAEIEQCAMPGVSRVPW